MNVDSGPVRTHTHTYTHIERYVYSHGHSDIDMATVSVTLPTSTLCTIIIALTFLRYKLIFAAVILISAAVV